MTSVNDVRKDILDAGSVTIPVGSGEVDTAWISTEGVSQVLVCMSPAGSGAYLQDSNDQSVHVRVLQLQPDATGSNGWLIAVPAAAFLRLAVTGSAGSSFTYSVRAVG